tara:strand:- start:12792 stop:13214 length:423 start_codon:yes stop_codon:yes gene_type:complete
MRTNNKKVRENVRKHILESMHDYNEESFKSFDDAREYLVKEFIRVYNHQYNKNRWPNNQDRFQNYLMGIVFNFKFTDYDIEKFLNGLGINPKEKKYTGEQMWRMYAYLIWREIQETYDEIIYIEHKSKMRMVSSYVESEF